MRDSVGLSVASGQKSFILQKEDALCDFYTTMLLLFSDIPLFLVQRSSESAPGGVSSHPNPHFSTVFVTKTVLS